MSLPTSRNRTYTPGVTPVSGADLNDVQDQIIHLMGDGELDVPLQANQGIVVPNGERIELGGTLRNGLMFTGVENLIIPYAAAIWTPADDADVLVDATDGYISALGVTRLHVPIILMAGNVITAVNVWYRRSTTDTWTAKLWERLILGAVVTELATATSATGSATDLALALNPASPHEVDEGAQYYVTVASSGGGGLRYYQTQVQFNRPPP